MYKQSGLQTPQRVQQDWHDGRGVLPSFWYVQVVGWLIFFLFILLATLPGLKRPATLWIDVLTVVFMFAGSCVLRPICNALQHSSLSWLHIEAWMLLSCLIVGPVASLFGQLFMMNFRKTSWGECLVEAVQFTIVLFLWGNLYLTAKYRREVSRKYA